MADADYSDSVSCSKPPATCSKCGSGNIRAHDGWFECHYGCGYEWEAPAVEPDRVTEREQSNDAAPDLDVVVPNGNEPNRAEPTPRGEVCSACGLDLADSESNVYCPWCLQGAQHYEARARRIIEGIQSEVNQVEGSPQGWVGGVYFATRRLLAALDAGPNDA